MILVISIISSPLQGLPTVTSYIRGETDLQKRNFEKDFSRKTPRSSGLAPGHCHYVCAPHPCQLCGSEVSPLGTHGVSCKKSGGRASSHAALNDIIKHTRYPVKVGTPWSLEVGWQEARWHVFGSMECWSPTGVGCHLPWHLYFNGYRWLASYTAGNAAAVMGSARGHVRLAESTSCYCCCFFCHLLFQLLLL